MTLKAVSGKKNKKKKKEKKRKNSSDIEIYQVIYQAYVMGVDSEHIIWAAPCENLSSDIWGQRRPRSA